MDPRQRNALALATVIVLVAVSWWLVWPPGSKINQALDIRGGLSVILTAVPAENQTQPTAEQMSRAETIITNRVNGLGVSEASVQLQGNDSILVQLPGVEDPEAALEALGSTGQLEFVDVASVQDTATIAALDSGQENVTLKRGTYQPFMTGEVITSANVGTDQQNQIVVNLTMNDAGTKTWAEYTASHVNQRVAIVLDGIIQSAPSIREPIPTGDTQISGDFTADEAKRLAAVLEAGALPVELEPSDTRVVGPTLGQESLRQGLLAGLAGLGLVALFMLGYYRGFGVLSWFSLAIFLSIFLGVLALLSRLNLYALSLPGVAAIVLSVGIAADSSILIFERFKEEVRLGKTYRSAAKSGTRHALWTSVDADLVTFVSAAVIFLVAIGPVRGFALALMLGIIIDLTTAFLFTRTMIILLAESVVPKAPGLFGLKGGDTDA